jgi:sugar lactone lactonase YvrE
MKRLSIVSLLIAAALAVGQDMPLHEILKPGEEWKPHPGDMPKTKASYSVDHRNRLLHNGEFLGDPVKVPTCCAVSLGGSTLLVADNEDRYVWAFQTQKDGTLGPGDRYCRLRVKSDDRRKTSTPPDAYRAEPSAMTVDAANRSYVATNLGVQVFDPTGRLCGVFPAPDAGRVSEMAFDGDRLFARAGAKVFVRMMLATGPKQ